MKLTTGITEEWFKPEEDNNTGAEFKLRPFTQLQRIDVRAYIAPSGRPTAESYAIGLAAGVVDWKGVTDETGKALAFKREYLKHLPESIQYQLLTKLFELSELKDDDAKNS
jgi:hypothetical protein